MNSKDDSVWDELTDEGKEVARFLLNYNRNPEAASPQEDQDLVLPEISQSPPVTSPPSIEDLQKEHPEMSIQQLLVKKHGSYKPRPSATSQRAQEMISKNLMDVPDQVYGLPTIPKSIVMGSVKEPLQDLPMADLWKKKSPKYSEKKFESVTPITQTVANALDLITASSEESISSEVLEGLNDTALRMLVQLPERAPRPDRNVYFINHLPWPVIWKKAPEFIEDNIYIYIEGCKYAQIALIIKAGVFQVPVSQPVPFEFEGKQIEVTLDEMLAANGINFYEKKNLHFISLQGALQKARVYIRTDYAERLESWQDARRSGAKVSEEKIELTAGTLPLVSLRPDVYMGLFGMPRQGAIIHDTTQAREPSPGQNSSNTKYSEELPVSVRANIVKHYDNNLPVYLIAEKSNCTISSVLETISTRRFFRIIRKHLKMMKQKSKIRRTHYVELNKCVWKHFKECQGAGVVINGKHLKDQAMKYARQMGLETFRGSEGWLDAFKRRHRIDLKTMTGYPVCYENDMFDEVERECRDLDMEAQLHQQTNHHQTQSVFGNTVGEEFVNTFFGNSNFFNNHQPQMLIPPPQQPEPSSHLESMLNVMVSTAAAAPLFMDSSRAMGNNNNTDTRPSTSADRGNNQQNGAAAQNGPGNEALLKSCQIKVQDKDVSHALNTIRSFILTNNIDAMNLFVQLQEKLAAAVVDGEVTSTSST
ncbi:unnamed protein product [Caenorhabditis brenneri]